MSDEILVKIVAFVAITIMYVVTVVVGDMNPNILEALWTAIVGLITTIIGYNVGKTMGKRRRS